MDKNADFDTFVANLTKTLRDLRVGIHKVISVKGMPF